KVADADPPADALEWELDNAIGAIIAGNQRAGPQATPALAPEEPEDVSAVAADRADLADGEVAPTHSQYEDRAQQETAHAPLLAIDGPQDAKAGANAGDKPEGPLEAAKARLAKPIGTLRRLKPIPSFRFDRRSDGEDEHAAPVDVDNPLSSVFFKDVRDEFDSVHPSTLADDDPGFAIPDTGPDGLGDEFAIDDRGAAHLPPSLSRAAAATRRPAFRFAGVATVLAGMVLVGIVAAVGINVFAGSDATGDEPPVIRADAADVKVRATTTGVAAEPDITVRTQLGESEELVLPEEEDVSRSIAINEPRAADGELISRRVRTVSVRPDGTIVAAELPGRSANAFGEEPQAPATEGFAAPATPEPEPQADPVEVAALQNSFGEADNETLADAPRDPFAEEGNGSAALDLIAPQSDENEAVAPTIPNAAFPRPRPVPAATRQSAHSFTTRVPPLYRTGTTNELTSQPPLLHACMHA
ncbi:MAG: hypothetical protein AAFW98_14955, partial [Pseudomonadota bacterium]